MLLKAEGVMTENSKDLVVRQSLFSVKRLQMLNTKFIPHTKQFYFSGENHKENCTKNGMW